MKRFSSIVALVAIMLVSNGCFSQSKVNWMSVDKAVSQSQKDGQKAKMFFIDCYTSWCGWCKVLDNKIFSNDTIAAILNYYFYPCKFDAEGQEVITINNQTYQGTKKGDKNSTHELMKLLWEGQRGGGYPTMALRGKDFSPVEVLMGYLPPADLEPVLIYYAEGFNKQMSEEKFKSKYKHDIRPKVLKKVFSNN